MTNKHTKEGQKRLLGKTLHSITNLIQESYHLEEGFFLITEEVILIDNRPYNDNRN